MSRYIKRDTSSLLRASDSDDEDRLYERQALIEDDELNSNTDSVNPFGLRQRQNRNKSPTDILGHELKNMNKSRDYITNPPVEFTLYDIKPDDSLQSICLRFACPISQVKRLNGLMNDQEFYGLNRIKLPSGKLSLREDVLRESDQANFMNDNNQLNGNTNHLFQPTSSTSNSLLMQQQHQTSLPPPPPIKIVNSPGSALSVNVNHNHQFKPLLSPGFSSDKINELNRASKNQFINVNGLAKSLNHNHSHSFSSLREFNIIEDNINIDLGLQNQHYPTTATRMGNQLGRKTFIKSDLNNHYDENVETDDILELGNDNVGKVFEDLDYQVEMAKAAAETYDRRAAEIVDKIDMNNGDIITNIRGPKKSKIPDLFYCNENMGLSYKKLIIFIFIFCVVAPLIYINQVSSQHSTRQH